MAVLEQCICHRLQGEDIVAEWVAYGATKGQLKLTLDALDQFEHEVKDGQRPCFISYL